MATVTGLTAERMLAIEAASVVDGEVVGSNLILSTYGGSTIDAGPVIGPQGPVGPQGPGSGTIPGEIRMWPGSALPTGASYGVWAWADGSVYPVATYPIAAANIATPWRTFAGASDPGGANFRVPDLRGLTPVGLDAMPGGGRANRMTRSVAIVIAGRTGEETHIVTNAEMPFHGHGVNFSDPGHVHSGNYFQNRGANPNSTAGGNAQSEYQGEFATPAATTGIQVSIQGNGGGAAHENVQPTVFVPYIVCLKS
jgi:microcystin-dependent protein